MMALADAVPFAVAHWSLDEASGTRADSINGYDLSDVNTVASGTGMFSNAGDFEAANSEHLEVVDNADLSPGDNKIMLRFWVKLETKDNVMILCGKGSGGSGEYIVQYRPASDVLRFNVWSSSGFGGESVAVDTTSPTLGVWYLVHAWHDSVADEIGISVNANTATTTAHSTGVFDTTGAFNVGRVPFDGSYLDGLIDDFVVLRGYILDATERTADYNGGAGVAFADWDAAASTVRPRSLLLMGCGC